MVAKGGAVEQAWSLGREVWADIDVCSSELGAHVERLGLEDERLLTHAADLFLVVGALAGHPRALGHFDTCLRRASRVAARLDRSEPFIDEVRQELGLRLLTGSAPRLLGYSAAGALEAWLRVAALRVGMNLKRSERLKPASDLELEDLVGGEEAYACERRYLGDFKAALEASLASVTPRERTLLRLHFVEGMNLDRMAIAYSVHRATIARWIAGARSKIFERAKLELAERHGLATADVRSLYRVLARDVNASISRLLRA